MWCFHIEKKTCQKGHVRTEMANFLELLTGAGCVSRDKRTRESPGTAGSCRCCRSRWNNMEPDRSCRRRRPPADCQTVVQHVASGPLADPRRRRRNDYLAKKRQHSKAEWEVCLRCGAEALGHSAGETRAHRAKKTSNIVMSTVSRCSCCSSSVPRDQFEYCRFLCSRFLITTIIKLCFSWC